MNAYAREAGLYRFLFDIKQLKNLGMTEKREYLWRFIALMGIFIPLCTLDLLQKKYVLSLKICSSLGQTLNYWVDWHLLKLAQPARL